MAQKLSVSFIDDLDGSVAEGTVAFAIDGKLYDIDLSATNAAKLRDILAPYVVQAAELVGTVNLSAAPLRVRPSVTRTRPSVHGLRRRG